MSAQVKGGHVIVGSHHSLEEHRGIRFGRHNRRIEKLQDEGKILLFVGNDAGPVGIIALRDTMRRDAPAALAQLRALGIKRLMMITGDRRAKGEALGTELGLDRVYAELPPEEKAAIVEALQRNENKVAYVGDGVDVGCLGIDVQRRWVVPRHRNDFLRDRRRPTGTAAAATACVPHQPPQRDVAVFTRVPVVRTFQAVFPLQLNCRMPPDRVLSGVRGLTFPIELNELAYQGCISFPRDAVIALERLLRLGGHISSASRQV